MPMIIFSFVYSVLLDWRVLGLTKNTINAMVIFCWELAKKKMRCIQIYIFPGIHHRFFQDSRQELNNNFALENLQDLNNEGTKSKSEL